jgi:hypothetical protein
MDYKEAWDKLSERLNDAVREGKEAGFDKPSYRKCFDNGVYEAYKLILREMMFIEKYSLAESYKPPHNDVLQKEFNLKKEI